MHAPYRGHRIVPAAAAPLDTFTAPIAAYGFRKLRTAYSGPGVRIRRASDDAELDIGFLGFVPGLGSPWDEAAATAHCAATTCFVRTWYDQSGNARDLIQATTVNQPQLVLGCQNGVACMQVAAATHSLASAVSVTPATGVATLSAVAKRVSGTAACVLLRENASAGQRFLTQNAAANGWQLNGGTSGSVIAAAADNAWHAGVGAVSGASSLVRIDEAETTGTATGSVTAGPVAMGGASATVCQEVEAILWDNTVLTPAERTALVNNQRSFWGF